MADSGGPKRQQPAPRAGSLLAKGHQPLKPKVSSVGRFVVSAGKSAKGDTVLFIEKNGVRKEVKVRFYSPDLAYHSGTRKKVR